MVNDNNGSEEVPLEERLKRPRGILTEGDRRHLVDLDESKDQSERNTRYRIRKRIVTAMYDFNILSGYLGDDDRRQVFEKLAQSGEGRACIETALSFFYTGVSDLSPDDSGTLEAFEGLVEVGIRRAESEKGVILDVNVDIDIDREEPDPDFLLDKVLANEATLSEYYALPQEQSVELLEKVIEQDEPHTLSFESSREEDGLEFAITPDNARENLKRISDTEEGDDITSN